MNLEDLLDALKTLTLVEIRVGPAGVHYDFAVAPHRPVAISLFSDARIKIRSKDTRGTSRISKCPPYSCQKELERSLLNRTVSAVEIHPGNNSLAIVLDDEIALMLYPETEREQETSWSLHCRSPDDTTHDWMPGWVVYAGRTEKITRAR